MGNMPEPVSGRDRRKEDPQKLPKRHAHRSNRSGLDHQEQRPAEQKPPQWPQGLAQINVLPAGLRHHRREFAVAQRTNHRQDSRQHPCPKVEVLASPSPGLCPHQQCRCPTRSSSQLRLPSSGKAQASAPVEERPPPWLCLNWELVRELPLERFLLQFPRVMSLAFFNLLSIIPPISFSSVGSGILRCNRTRRIRGASAPSRPSTSGIQLCPALPSIVPGPLAVLPYPSNPPYLAISAKRKPRLAASSPSLIPKSPDQIQSLNRRHLPSTATQRLNSSLDPLPGRSPPTPPPNSPPPPVLPERSPT